MVDHDAFDYRKPEAEAVLAPAVSLIGSVEAVPQLGQVGVGDIFACVEYAYLDAFAPVGAVKLYPLLAGSVRNRVGDVVADCYLYLLLLSVAHERGGDVVDNGYPILLKLQREM